MNAFLHNRQEQILAILTILFIVGTVAYYIWGVHTIANAIQTSINITPNKSDIVHFNLEDAQKIDFRENAQQP